MKWFSEKKWMLGCIVLSIILFILSVSYLTVYKQNNMLRQESINNMKAEWYQLYHLSENIDRYYIKNNFQDADQFRWYVNQTCHHFGMTGRPNELTVNMRNLLIQAYDSLYADLYAEEDTLNKEKAREIFHNMNQALGTVSKDILDMQDNELENLLDPSSSEYIKFNTQVKDVSDKYTGLVDNYFRENKK